jgi:hypothetical protein
MDSLFSQECHRQACRYAEAVGVPIKVSGHVSGREVEAYQADKIWSSARTAHNINITDFPTKESLERYFEGLISGSRLANLGPLGRSLVFEEAVQEWSRVPEDVRLVPLMAMRERGMITVGEFHEFAEQAGLTHGEADYKYGRWSGTEQAIWDMKFKGLLSYGEYAKVIRVKGLSKGQAWYRYRKYCAITFNHGFRGWENRKVGQKILPKPRSSYRRQP